MRIVILTLIAIAAWVRPSPAQRIATPFPGYVPQLAAEAARAHRAARRPDDASRPRLDLAVWIGGSLGAGAGLLGGYDAGGTVADHFDVDCCGDDPGLQFRLLGAVVGTVLGTALGGELGARLAGRPSRPFGRRLVGGLAGMVAGGMTVVLLDRAVGIETGPALAAYSVTAGLAASVLQGPPTTHQIPSTRR